MTGKLRVVQGPDLGRDFPLTPGELKAGRDPGHAICLTDRSASRSHFLLHVSGGGVRLVDLGSRNATRVNGTPVQEKTLRNGDVIEVGRTRMECLLDPCVAARAPAVDAPAPIPAPRPLQRVGRLMAAAESAGELADALVALVVEITGATAGVLATCGTDGHWVVQSGGAKLCEEAAHRALEEGAARDPERLSVRLTGFGHAQGILQAEGRHFGPEDVEFAALLGELAGPVLGALQARDALLRERARLLDVLCEESDLDGESAGMVEVRRWIARAAVSAAPVLLVGETGAGKRRAARAIHLRSDRAHRGFFAHDCGAAAGDAGTALANAGGGTCLLAHVDRLPPGSQVDLVRALAAGTEARMIASTRRDLSDEAKAGRFREDLFFRLGVITIRIPPLRERGQDVPELARKLGAHRVPEDWGDRPWPGNVRELRQAVESLLD